MMSIKSHPIPRVAMVTGAAGSIGSAVVRNLGKEGWKVAGVDLKKVDADLFLPVDVTDRAAMKAAAAGIADELGPVNLLVTAAGDNEKNAIGDMAPARWQRMLDVWLGGTTNACAAVVPQMIEAGSGTVVLLSSDLSSHGKQNSYVAAASGTVVAFAKSFGCEVAADGVCVNCLATRPPTNTEWVAQTVSFLANDGHYYAGQGLGRATAIRLAEEGARVAVNDLDTHPDLSLDEVKAMYARDIPMDRVGDPAEVAATIAFLAAEGGPIFSGQIVQINGGLSRCSR